MFHLLASIISFGLLIYLLGALLRLLFDLLTGNTNKH